jgi:hypothetical protein
MKNRLCISLACALLAIPIARADTDEEVQARRTVLDLAGAFTNDGFKLRDGHWIGTVQPKERRLIAVNLYAGNQYWFAVGAGKSKKVAVDVYDEAGKLVPAERYASEEGEKAAAGVTPNTSGQYYVSVGLTEGEPGSVCLVYSYK